MRPELTAGTLCGTPVQRAPELDAPGTARPEAWRMTDPCDHTCHHPAHALGVRRPRRHVEWLAAGSPEVKL